MDNPFRRRATEFLREDEAFLAVVTPEPIKYFLEEAGKSGRLYDRLVLLRGTPGSGKTTLARLFEYPTFHTLSQNRNFEGHKDISSALASCGAMQDGLPRVLGFRLPLETDYRDFWEFGYREELKTNLMTALLQARAVLGWFRHLKKAGIGEDEVAIVTRPEASDLVNTIGGADGRSIRERAAKVENAIYQVMNSLVAPDEAHLPSDAIQPYRPFDIIDRIQIPLGEGISDLIPLAIFDDAHLLHPEQFRSLEKFLLRRELRVARWMIARFDILVPQEALEAVSQDATDAAKFPGVSAERETEKILLQSSGLRRTERTRFRKMAKDMASRYLRRMPVLSERGLTNITNLLGDTIVAISPPELARLKKSVGSTQKSLEINAADRSKLERQIEDFKKADTEEVQLQMLKVMMHRFAGRRRRIVPSLFPADDQTESDVQVAANADVYSAAVFNLFHDHKRPYYFGIDDVCDASSENAEQFLQLTAELVEEIVTQVARGKSVQLTPQKQNVLLRKCGEKFIYGWNFPHDRKVKNLVDEIARRCFEKSREPNGAVIANAVGIPQEQFDRMAKDYPVLATVLQFAIAYNAVSLVPHHSCKSKSWCLLELGGMVLLKHGLTLKRGGFIESNADELSTLLTEPKR
ncbi:hypothetical protein NZK35_06330 [Stieleria sp. ICT_E10.1]|uniref:hypothetical protein n=1 Tax=Stieleria sedimenti TaxID=2976331 RepID=UPI00217FFBB9|nr:hypothetical protein [Stieleria sedimenti]MCS7466291.1 hypothetical protein [Stieleria sedimenti]